MYLSTVIGALVCGIIIMSRRFGTSKRFAESDKKEMAELIAIKLQIADDEYRQETAKLVEQLAEAGRVAEQRQRTERRLDSILRDFVRQHEKQLVGLLAKRH